MGSKEGVMKAEDWNKILTLMRGDDENPYIGVQIADQLGVGRRKIAEAFSSCMFDQMDFCKLRVADSSASFVGTRMVFFSDRMLQINGYIRGTEYPANLTEEPEYDNDLNALISTEDLWLVDLDYMEDDKEYFEHIGFMDPEDWDIHHHHTVGYHWKEHPDFGAYFATTKPFCYLLHRFLFGDEDPAQLKLF